MKFLNPRPVIAIAFSFLVFTFTAKGQYYPGGLGNTNLQLWLDANDLTTITKNGSNQVSAWVDKSISSSPLTLAQAAPSNQPLFAAAGLNGRRSLTFSHSGPDFLALQSTAAADTTYFQGYNSFSHFCVYNSSDNATQSPTGKSTIYGRELVWKTQIISGGTGALDLYASANGVYWTTGLASSAAIPENSNVLFSAIYNAATTYSAFNASNSLGSVALGGQVLGNSANNFCVGGRAAGVEPFTGNIGEVLIYKTNLSTTARIIMENYLSAKWGITLGANVYYTPPTASTYGTNLVGIGYTSGTDNFLSDVAGSTDGLGFSSSSGATGFLNSAGYLMAAHNGQANTILSNTAITGIGPALDLWNRSWYLNLTGGNSSGPVTVNFNFANYNGSALPGAANYFLVYNATDGSFGTGTNQVVAVSNTSAGSTVSFAVKASSLLNGYYTIMWPPSGSGVSPVNATSCAGSNASFSISAINGFTYQWQVNTGGGFGNVPVTDPGGAVYSGSGSTTLTISGVTSSMNGYTYQVILTPANGTSITEGPATLTVQAAPAAGALAASSNPICAGSSTTLSMTSPVAGVTYNVYSDPGFTTLVGSLTSAANTLVVSPAVTTTYYERAVETATGCVQTAASQTITVTVNAAPAGQALAASSNPICAGSSTTLSMTSPVAGVTYNVYSDPGFTTLVGSLTSAANTLVVSPAVTTTYYERAVETATGCVQTAASQTITVTVNAAPAGQALAASSNPICAGSSTTLSMTGPVPGVTYNVYSDPGFTTLVGSLTSAANTLVVSPAVTTTYYERAVETATGCVQTAASQTITVTVNAAPAGQALAASSNPICAGSSTTLSMTSPVAGVTYNIYSNPGLTVLVGPLTSAANTLVVSPAVTTTYYERAVETATGCVQTAASQTITVTVNAAPTGQALAASGNPICAGSSTTLSMTNPVVGVTYNVYSDPGFTTLVGSLTSTANTLVVSPAVTTTYYERAVETATGCVQTAASQTITVTVNAAPTGQALAASGNPICAGSSTTLSMTNPVAGVTYNVYSDPGFTTLVGSLTSAANTLVVSPAVTTTYYERAVETATGCVQTAASQTITVTVNAAPAGQALAASSNPICAGSSTTLSMTSPVAGVTYNIYSNPGLTVLVGTLTSAANTLVVSPAVTTTYYERAVETATGCVQTAASQTITVTVNAVPAGQALAASSNPICAGSSTTLSMTGPVPGVTYNVYSDPGFTTLVGSLTSAANTLVVSPAVTTTYYERAVETATGCVQTAASQTITVAVNAAPAGQALAASSNPICAGSSTTLSMTSPVAGVTYNIYSNPGLTVLVGSLTSAANTLVVSPAVTTTYYERAVETATGCVQTAASQTITVTVNAAPTGQALAASGNPICAGSSTTLSMTNPVAGVTYNVYSDPGFTTLVGSLTSAANTLVVSPAVTTTYYERAVETATGCVQTAASQTITVTVNAAPAGQALAASSNPICAGSSTTLSMTNPVVGVTYNVYSDPGFTTLVGSLTSAANTLVVSPAVTTTYFERAVETATGCVQTAASQAITVTVNAAPAGQALAASSNPICAGSSTTLSMTSPVAGVTYNIYSNPGLTVLVGTLTSAANTLVVSPAVTTTYYERAVETATGCVQTAPSKTIVVTVNAVPAGKAIAASINPICLGSSTTLSISAPIAGVTYNIYSDPALTALVGTLTSTTNTLVVSPGATTTYYEQAVETVTGCVQTSASQTISVTVNAVPSGRALATNSSPICAGSIATLSIIGPVAGMTYNVYSDPALTVLVGTLTPAANTLVVSPGVTTTYYEQATATATGCIQTAPSQTITVAVNPAPASEALSTSSNPICLGGSATLSMVAPVPGVNYNIYTDAALTVLVGTLTSANNTLVVSPAVTTTYYEQAVEALTGCLQTAGSETITVTVNAVPASQALLAGANPICLGSSTTLSLSSPQTGVTYNIYSDPALSILVGTLTATANALSVSPEATTTYYEQAVETATGCVQTAASQLVMVTVNPLPAGQALSATTNPVCPGQSTTLSITTPVTGVTYYVYSDPALTMQVGVVTSAENALVVSPTATTTYYEQAQSSAGCQQPDSIQSIVIALGVNPVLTTTANLNLCEGLLDTLSATAPGAQITWLGYTPGDSIIVSPSTTTTYVAVAENATNCKDTAAVSVQVIDFKISLTASPDPIVAGYPVTLVAQSSLPYQVLNWAPTLQFPDQTATTQTFTIVDTSQTFTVIGINDNGCLDTTSVTVVVQPNLGDFFIPNAFTPNGDGRNDVFQVYGSSIRQIDIRIFNQWGQLVFESQDAQRGWNGYYSGHLQPAGVYLYAIKVDLYGQTKTIYKKGSLNLIR